MHASIMIFFVIIPILVGAFANFVVPLQIGAHDMAFPFLNALSYWLMWPAFIFMGVSFFVEGHGAGSMLLLEEPRYVNSYAMAAPAVDAEGASSPP